MFQELTILQSWVCVINQLKEEDNNNNREKKNRNVHSQKVSQNRFKERFFYRKISEKNNKIEIEKKRI